MDALNLADRFRLMTWPAVGGVCFPSGFCEEERTAF
jgi:hypothetical protein